MEADNYSQELTLDQERALKIMRSGRNIFLSGAAGTGKSYLIETFIRENRDKNIVVCAPTGVAAVNIGGATLHRVFWMPVGVLKMGAFNANPSYVLEKADIIIIDEISMCRIDAFEYVVRTLQAITARRIMQENEKHVNKQLIVIGDFYQLPPVISVEDQNDFFDEWGLLRGEDLFAFNSALWDELEFVNIILKTPIRQSNDIEYLDNLNKLRVGDTAGIEWFNSHLRHAPIEDAVYICGRNDQAAEINDATIESLSGETRTYYAMIEGQVNPKDIPVNTELTLKMGMRVMIVINSRFDDYQNGSIGYITNMTDKYIEIKLGNYRTVHITPFTWEIFNYEVEDDKINKERIGSFTQYPIKLAYAITIHKSQGQTYSAVNIMPECFDKGQLYVALSRVKKADQMSISRDIDVKFLRTSQTVCEFYDDIDDELLGYEFDEHKWDKEPDVGSDSKKDESKLPYMYRIMKVRPQAYSSWTEEEEEQLQREWAEGESLSNIARKHERTVGAIRSRLRHMLEDEA